jgi:hypothetical protein
MQGLHPLQPGKLKNEEQRTLRVRKRATRTEVENERKREPLHESRRKERDAQKHKAATLNAMRRVKIRS